MDEQILERLVALNAERAAEVLDSLAALGFLASSEVDGSRRWKAPDRAAA